MLDRLTSGVRSAVSGAASHAEAALNQTTLRVGVTGLSRAGKTVFLTSLLNNLIALGQGRHDTLPRLQAVLARADGGARLRRVRVVPAGTATTPYFDYQAKLAELAAEQSAWPPRTEDLAQIALDLDVERRDGVKRRLGPYRVRLELLDYPGEWLLDLPLLHRSYAQWSGQTLATLRAAPHAALCAPFLEFLGSVAPGDAADDVLLRRGHTLYRQALQDCRTRLGLRHLQPGRFLCPGPRGDAPFLWFFPLPGAPEHSAPGTASALLRDRYEAYKAHIRTEFFGRHFAAFDRQIVLVDVLGALRAGRAAFEDTSRALADIAAGLTHAGEHGNAVLDAGAAALRAGKALLGASAGRIERVAFVATKADHVPALRRKNLENLLRDLVGRAGGERLFAGRPASFHVAASVLSTRDDVAQVEGRPVEVVRGQVMGEAGQRPFFCGDVPSGYPPEGFWAYPFFELPCFTPPRIDPSGQAGIAHLGLDEVLASLLGDAL